MGTVDVSVGHEDNAVIAQPRKIEVLPDIGAQRGDECLNLLVGQRLVQARLFNIENFAAQRQNSLEAAIATLQSEVQALRSREAELKLQIAGFEESQARLFALEPELQVLERRRDGAERAFAALEAVQAGGLAQAGAAGREAAAVRVLERANVPVSGESLRLPVLIGAVFLAGLTALMAGMIRAFTRRGLATPGSAGRTLGLPVLASVQKY